MRLKLIAGLEKTQICPIFEMNTQTWTIKLKLTNMTWNNDRPPEITERYFSYVFLEFINVNEA